jgi:dynein heavy chain
MGFTTDRQNFHNVSLGQGQEVVAEEAMEIAAKLGHWVVLQVNILVKIEYIPTTTVEWESRVAGKSLFNAFKWEIF